MSWLDAIAVTLGIAVWGLFSCFVAELAATRAGRESRSELISEHDRQSDTGQKRAA
jgi:hypothetical protein